MMLFISTLSLMLPLLLRCRRLPAMLRRYAPCRYLRFRCRHAIRAIRQRYAARDMLPLCLMLTPTFRLPRRHDFAMPTADFAACCYACHTPLIDAFSCFRHAFDAPPRRVAAVLYARCVMLGYMPLIARSALMLRLMIALCCRATFCHAHAHNTLMRWRC